jgi:Flp pilus assembly protein TadG
MFVVLLPLFLLLVPALARAATIDLGGPREAKVEIDGTGETYALGVSARAVKSFDDGSDREANRALARSFALTALSRHLKLTATQELSVSGLVAGAESVAGDRFKIAFNVPKAGVKVVERPTGVANLRLDPEFTVYLTADPLLMEVEGAKVIRLDAGLEATSDEPRKLLVLGVASSAIQDGSAADRKRAETIARNRAYAHIVAENTGVTVARSETIGKKTTVTIDEDGRETGTSVAEYLETTQAGVKGMTKGFPIVGRWTSPDGTLLYVAVGGILSPSPAE